MTTLQGRRVCYLLSHYISHRKAGLAYRDCMQGLGIELVDSPGDAEVVIVHNEPWSYPGYFRAFPDLRDRYVVFYTVWETDRLPDHYRFAISLADEVWTCSAYCKAVLADAVPRVTVIPHVVLPSRADPVAEEAVRRRIDYRDDVFYFYTIGSAANPRKGILEAIRAFDGLFPMDRARFLVKSSSPLPPEALQVPGVVPLYGRMEEAEIQALHRIAHCFVSAHRSEGWGLGLSEAMAAERLVVATAFSGNMEFMDQSNSLPVAFTLEQIRDADVQRQRGLLSGEMTWAYADIEDLRAKMVQSCTEWESLAPLRRKAGRDIARYAPGQVAPIVGERLKQILAGPAVKRAAAR